ncbi:hypothetical protein DFQ26_005148 [Actinomortierella ambigua]|nr:hypothetical protein DFQ26_005148 [Actinomortierella ambigua]
MPGSSKLSAAALGGFAQFASPSFQASQSYVASTTPGRTGSPSGSSGGNGSSIGGAGGGGGASFDGDLSGVQVISNGELAMILKRLMTKRDTTTKLRALEDLETWVRGQPEDEPSSSSSSKESDYRMTPTQEAIGPWVKLYTKLTTDVDRRVRFSTNTVHALMVRRAKKKLAPFLKEVLGSWLGTFFDPSRDVARLASESFQAAFPDSKKREQVLLFCLKDLVSHHLSELLLVKTPETLSDPRFTTPEERETRFARVAASALYTLGYLFEHLSEEGWAKQGATAEIDALLDNQKLWKYFAYPHPMVRRAAYSLLRMILHRAAPRVIPSRLELVASEFFPAALNDTDQTTHGDLWDALLMLTKHFPESWQVTLESKKPVMVLFTQFLKAAGHGSTLVTYRGLLPLASSWNDATVVGKQGTGLPFIRTFFDDIWKGLEAPLLERGKDGAGRLLEAYVECLVYFTVRFGKSETTQPGQLAVMEMMTTLVKQFLQGFPASKPAAAAKLDDEANVAKRISTHLAVLLGVPSLQDKVMEGVWNPVVEGMLELVATYNQGTNREYVRRGKRAVLLLSELSRVAAEKGDEALSEKVDKAVDRLVQVVAKQCASTGSFGPSQLLSQFALHFEVVVFSNTDSQQAIPAFFDSQFVNMLLTTSEEPSTVSASSSDDQQEATADTLEASSSSSTTTSNESLSHLLDLFAGYLSHAKEPETAAKVWRDVMQSILQAGAPTTTTTATATTTTSSSKAKAATTLRTDHQVSVVQGILERTRRAATALPFSLQLEALDRFVLSITTPVMTPVRQQLIQSALRADSIVGAQVRVQIAERLVEDLERHVKELESASGSGGVTVTSGGGGAGTAVVASLHILSQACEDIVPLLLLGADENGDDGDECRDLLERMIVCMFDPTLHHEADAQECLQMIRLLSKGDGELKDLLKDALKEHIMESLHDMTRTVSPVDFVNQVRQLASLLDLQGSDDKFSLYKDFFFDAQHWRDLRQSASPRRPDMSLAMRDPIVAALYCGEIPSTLSSELSCYTRRPLSSAVPPSDVFGLTAYGRLAVFTFELLRRENWTVLVLRHPHEMTWILKELLVVRQLFLDALQLPSLQTSGGSGSGSGGVGGGACGLFSTEEGQHAEANTIVFRAMARDIGSLVMQWIAVAVQDGDDDEPWETRLLRHWMDGAGGANEDEDGDETDMIERGLLSYFRDLVVYGVDGYSERILSELLRTAIGVTESDVTASDAKAWCQILKNDTDNLSVSTAIVVTLANRLSETTEFTNLLNYWASELGATRPHEASASNKLMIRRLVLLSSALVAMSTSSSSSTLPQHRTMHLLQAIRRWEESESALFAPQGGQQLEDQHPYLVFAQLLTLLNSLADQVQELPGAHWDLMVGLVDRSFEMTMTTTPTTTLTTGAMVVLERASRLAVKLIELGETEEDIQRTWEEHGESILVHALQAVGREAAEDQGDGRRGRGGRRVGMEPQMDRPRREYQEALARLCEHADRAVVLSHGSMADYCGLLRLPSTALQRLAYRQLEILLAERVEALAIQLEVAGPLSPLGEGEEEEDEQQRATAAEADGDGDKMDRPVFPRSLWALISQPPLGYPVMDVNVDADDDEEERTLEFSFLASPAHAGHEDNDETPGQGEEEQADDDDDDDDDHAMGESGVVAKEEKLMSHEVLGYLLAWKLAFSLFENTTYKVKSGLAGQLRQAATMEGFLPYLFHLLGIRPGGDLSSSSSSPSPSAASTAAKTGNHGSSRKKSKAGQEPFDLSRWSVTEYHVEGLDLASPEIGFPLLAGHLYYACLANVPSLARIWWTECKSRQLSIAAEQLTEKSFSSLLVVRELDALNKAQAQAQAAPSSALAEELKDLQIKVSKNTSEVTASFQIDEATMEIVIRLPSNFPLRQIEVEGTQRVGVKEARWRAWMLAVAGVVAAQNGSLIDALTMFRRNVGLHFDGVEDCTICYSIVSLQDRSLPTKTCKTCKNKFHASCLYKWFHSSANSASCPLCRTLW